MSKEETRSGLDPDLPAPIGPFKILDILGEGAMGTVYLAEQKDPVRRRVALKVIKLGMDSKEVLVRFELERQALAVMNHEAIAKVFEAGTTERGQPYFVMELVEGVPFTAYCDEHRLSVSERIELFEAACAGVQHAHQKGVLHRDLKPGNVLVSRQGDRHVPKIIDFGVARATDHQLVEHTVYTEQGAIVGTPEYMSPEQAGGTALDLDTRTDIYSLGVLLYQLLTGELPFPREELRKGGLLAMQRIIREKEPLKPSTKVSSSGAVAVDWAARRRTSPPSLARALRGDLDWVVLKAMAKEPERRYASAAALSQDLENYLAGRAVVARPPSPSYLLAKFVRRHKLEVAAGLLLFLVTAAGFAVSAIFAVKATNSAADYQNLLAGARLDALEYRAQQAYPPWPANHAELTALIAEAEELLDSVPRQQEVVDELRLGNMLAAPKERAPARGPHFEEARRDRFREEISFLSRQLPDPGASAAAKAAGRQEIELLQEELERGLAAIEESNRVGIESAEDQFFHDRLEMQLRRLRLVENTLLPDLRFRAEWAVRVRRESIDDHREAWERAITAIREHPAYEGLELEPQLGLVPLDPDPDSRLWEFAHLFSGELPERDANGGQLALGLEHGIVFVLLPPGNFRFGYHDRVPKEHLESYPERSVQPFFLAKYELSRAQWIRLARGQVGLRLHDGGLVDLRNRYDQPEKPANGVTCLMCEALLQQYGLELPRDFQWEYACKAGTTSLWNTGNTVESLLGYANVRDLAYARRHGDRGGGIAPIDDEFFPLAPTVHFKGNRFGLHQMHGNVFEWCADVEAGLNSKRACRGGSFNQDHTWAYSFVRDVTVPSDSSRELGLRPARRIRTGLITDWK